MRKLAICAILFLAIVLLTPATVTCPIDGSGAYFTGNTKTDVSGKLLHEYKCNRFQHVFWVVAN